MSQEQASEMLGFGQSALSQYLNGKIPLNVEAATKIAKLVGCSVSDFSESLSKQVAGYITVYGTLPALLLEASGGPTEVPNVAPAHLGAQRIPLIDYVQAGAWTESTGGEVSEWLLTHLELSGDAFALEIKGNSMTPDFQPGDRVIIDPAVEPHPGDFVVAKNGNHEATFKKYRPRGVNERGQQVIELIPLNSDHPTLRSDTTPLHIIGTMVEHRKFRKAR